MNQLLSRVALAAVAAGLFGALAPAAVAQTSISVNRKGGNMLPTRFTVELRDAAGNVSGKSIIDHPGMGIHAQLGFVPPATVTTLETAVANADLAHQPADEWTGALPDIATQTFTDEAGDTSTLHPMRGPHGIDVTAEMKALSQAMSDAQAAFAPGTGPAPALPFLTYTYGGGWIGQITLDIASDGACHLHGSGSPRFSGIDMSSSLTPTQLDHMKQYMKRYAANWAAYPPIFGHVFPDGTYETITYTDDQGNAKTVERWGRATPKAVWKTVELFLKGEANLIDPALKL